MGRTRVVVHGATGKMGREVLAAICQAPDTQVVGAVCRQPNSNTLDLPQDAGTIPVSSNLADLLMHTQAQVVVDFTNAEAGLAAALTAAGSGVHCVIGSSGIDESGLVKLDQTALKHSIGIIVAPNFAIGAVVLLHLASQAASFFEYAEIVEAHHETKIDSPSGTAIALARELAKKRQFQHKNSEKESLVSSRGAELGGIGIHSLRMAGRSAHHEVIFGTMGQSLSLRHDTIGRACYMPGVLYAVREVVNLNGLVVGLEKILGL